MRDVLGYHRFAAQGGDWGSFISAYLGFTQPEHVIGIHLNLIPLRREPLPDSAATDPEFEALPDRARRAGCARKPATAASRAPSRRRWPTA